MVDNIAEVLSEQNLHRLISGDIIAIHRRGYCDSTTCELARRRFNVITENDWSNPYKFADVDKIGSTLSELETKADLEEYLKNAAKAIRAIRNLVFADRLSPLDRLRLDLTEIWSAGIELIRYDGKNLGRYGKPMLPYTIRKYLQGTGGANPHQDPKEVPLLEKTFSSRLGVNVYLDMPEQGGELIIWTKGLSKEDYQSIFNKDSHGVNQTKLYEFFEKQGIEVNQYKIKPNIGDLVIFNATRLHEVRPVDSGTRLTASCFLAVEPKDNEGREKPLWMFA